MLANDKDDAGWFTLRIAASTVLDEIIKALLERGAQVNAVPQTSCILLHYAASKSRHKLPVMFLEGGANPDGKAHYESKTMHWAAAEGNLK